MNFGPTMSLPKFNQILTLKDICDQLGCEFPDPDTHLMLIPGGHGVLMFW